jgi:RNA 3'-terminal phosphate cyclase
MVPCPVGCGGFSEVVRVGTLPNGSGEVWFECLSCAQRRQFILPKATRNENAEVAKAEEEGREAVCPRHKVHVALRRRGRQFVCPTCGVVYSP